MVVGWPGPCLFWAVICTFRAMSISFFCQGNSTSTNNGGMWLVRGWCMTCAAAERHSCHPYLSVILSRIVSLIAPISHNGLITAFATAALLISPRVSPSPSAKTASPSLSPRKSLKTGRKRRREYGGIRRHTVHRVRPNVVMADNYYGAPYSVTCTTETQGLVAVLGLVMDGSLGQPAPLPSGSWSGHLDPSLRVQQCTRPSNRLSATATRTPTPPRSTRKRAGPAGLPGSHGILVRSRH